MPAYWVARAKVNDPVEYKKYADRVPAIFAKYGAKVLTRGGRYQTLEGQEKFNRFVVIEFPSFEQGVACFYSQEYRRSEEHTSELQSPCNLVCRLLLEKKKNTPHYTSHPTT